MIGLTLLSGGLALGSLAMKNKKRYGAKLEPAECPDDYDVYGGDVLVSRAFNIIKKLQRKSANKLNIQKLLAKVNQTGNKRYGEFVAKKQTNPSLKHMIMIQPGFAAANQTYSHQSEIEDIVRNYDIYIEPLPLTLEDFDRSYSDMSIGISALLLARLWNGTITDGIISGCAGCGPVGMAMEAYNKFQSPPQILTEDVCFTSCSNMLCCPSNTYPSDTIRMFRVIKRGDEEALKNLSMNMCNYNGVKTIVKDDMDKGNFDVYAVDIRIQRSDSDVVFGRYAECNTEMVASDLNAIKSIRNISDDIVEVQVEEEGLHNKFVLLLPTTTDAIHVELNKSRSLKNTDVLAVTDGGQVYTFRNLHTHVRPDILRQRECDPMEGIIGKMILPLSESIYYSLEFAKSSRNPQTEKGNWTISSCNKLGSLLQFPCQGDCLQESETVDFKPTGAYSDLRQQITLRRGYRGRKAKIWCVCFASGLRTFFNNDDEFLGPDVCQLLVFQSDTDYVLTEADVMLASNDPNCKVCMIEMRKATLTEEKQYSLSYFPKIENMHDWFLHIWGAIDVTLLPLRELIFGIIKDNLFDINESNKSNIPEFFNFNYDGGSQQPSPSAAQLVKPQHAPASKPPSAMLLQLASKHQKHDDSDSEWEDD